MNNSDWFSTFLHNRRLAYYVSNFLVCLMMVCASFGLVQLGQKIAPGWNGTYVVVLSFLASLESIYTFHAAKEREGRELLFFRLSEIITILILIKILIYGMRGFHLLLQELPGWQSNFFLAFFTPEYLFAVFVVSTVWIFSQAFANEIDDLHNREEDASWDEIGKVQNNLKATRTRLIDQTLYLGSALIFLAIITKADLSNLQQIRFDAAIPVANVVAYFVLGLLLLAQTQFALLQTRWVWEKIPVLPGLSQIWIRYSVIFFVFLGVLVFFLPTDYSVGLLDVLRFLILFIWQIIAGIIFLLTLFFSYLLSLLLGQSQVPPAEPVQVSPPVLPDTVPQTSIAWIEYLKSALFWIVLLAIIAYALTNYIRQNAALLEMIKRIPLVSWLFRGLTGLFAWLGNINQKFLSEVGKAASTIQARAKNTLQRVLRRVTAYWLLSPADQIQFFFANLLETASQRGYPRRNEETPFTFSRKLEQDLTGVKEDLSQLSEEFVESRYSNHPISADQAHQARAQWEKIIAYLRHPPKKKP